MALHQPDDHSSLSINLPFRFNVRNLLGFTTIAAIFLGSMCWIHRSDQLGNIDVFPVLFVPSVPMLGFGILVVPIICLTMLAFIVAKFIRTPRRPYLIPLFVSVVLAPLIVELVWRSATDYSARWLVAIAVSAVAALGEALVRRLSRPHLEAATLAIAVAAGFYVFLMCAQISAGI